MKRMIYRGRFVQTANVLGNGYATTFQAVDDVFKEGKVCVMDLELEVC